MRIHTIGSYQELPETNLYILLDHDLTVMYVGKTRNIRTRLREHELGRPSSSYPYRKAIVITGLEPEDAKKLEALLIAYYRPSKNVHLQPEKRLYLQ